MAGSTYQVERFIDRLRRLRGWLPWPAYRRWRDADPVRLGRAAREAAGAAAPGAGDVASAPSAGTPAPSLEAVRERHRYPPAVEAERERRAGSFMEPPYPEAPPQPPIPRLGHWPPHRRNVRPRGEG